MRRWSYTEISQLSIMLIPKFGKHNFISDTVLFMRTIACVTCSTQQTAFLSTVKNFRLLCALPWQQRHPQCYILPCSGDLILSAPCPFRQCYFVSPLPLSFCDLLSFLLPLYHPNILSSPFLTMITFQLVFILSFALLQISTLFLETPSMKFLSILFHPIQLFH